MIFLYITVYTWVYYICEIVVYSEGDTETSDKPVVKETKQERQMREWKEAVEGCKSVSRLHVLTAVLETCVKWEKSAENAVRRNYSFLFLFLWPVLEYQHYS